jgi:two-component system chemotaxis sensor kinase CheA
LENFEIELKQDFLEESADLIEAAESAFLQLETSRNDSDLLNEIFRLAHNLKGTSRAVGFEQLAELTHIAENLILKLKEGTKTVDDDVVTVLLEFKDKIVEIIEAYNQDLSATFELSEIIGKLEKVTNSDASSSNHEEEPAVSAQTEESTDSSMSQYNLQKTVSIHIKKSKPFQPNFSVEIGKEVLEIFQSLQRSKNI